MYTNQLHTRQQNLLIHKGQFKTKQEASNHARNMGYQSDMMPNSITDNFYRFKHDPNVKQDSSKNEQLDRSRNVPMVGNSKTHIMGHDYHKLLDHESLRKQPKDIKPSLFNPKVDPYGNLIKPAFMPGQNGTGLGPINTRNMGYLTANMKSELTPINQDVKPFIPSQDTRLQYTSGILPRKSYFDSTQGRNSKKYF